MQTLGNRAWGNLNTSGEEGLERVMRKKKKVACMVATKVKGILHLKITADT